MINWMMILRKKSLFTNSCTFREIFPEPYCPTAAATAICKQRLINYLKSTKAKYDYHHSWRQHLGIQKLFFGIKTSAGWRTKKYNFFRWRESYNHRSCSEH